MKQQLQRYFWLASAFFLAGTASAQVQPETSARPWERDVSAEERRLAETLFIQAVEFHEQLLRDQAVPRYEEALSHWENPHIRWNLALLMKDMGQYLRAHEHLERALAWGPQAFDEHDREKLFGMQQMLLQQHLAVVQARCDQPGAEVTFDGKSWFRGPGEARQVVLPGEHVITARRAGYFPIARNIVLPAGTLGAVTVSMSVDRISEKHRWRPWKPWAVFASGVVVGMVGAAFAGDAVTQRDWATRELKKGCFNDTACDPATPRSYTLALWEHRIGTGAMVGGATLAAAGLVLVLLNQPHPHRTEDRDRGTFEVVPMASPDKASVSALFRF